MTAMVILACILSGLHVVLCLYHFWLNRELIRLGVATIQPPFFIGLLIFLFSGTWLLFG